MMPAKANSIEREAKREDREARQALKNRRKTDFARTWYRLPEDLIDAGERYATWHERGQPVTMNYGESYGGSDGEQRFIEYDLMKRAEAEVYQELGTIGHYCLHAATIHGMSGVGIAEARLVHLSRADMKALGAEIMRQRLLDIKRKFAVGITEKALQIVYDVFHDNIGKRG